MSAALKGENIYLVLSLFCGNFGNPIPFFSSTAILDGMSFSQFGSPFSKWFLGTFSTRVTKEKPEGPIFSTFHMHGFSGSLFAHIPMWCMCHFSVLLTSKKKSRGTSDFLRKNSCVIRCTKDFWVGKGAVTGNMYAQRTKFESHMGKSRGVSRVQW